MPAKKKAAEADSTEATEPKPIAPSKPKKPAHECPKCHSEMKVFNTAFGTSGPQYQCTACRTVKTFKSK